MTDNALLGTADHFRGSEVIESLLTAFYSGDIPTVQSHLAPDVVVHQSAGLPYSGDFVGIDGFMRMATELGGNFEIENLSRRIVDSGNESVLFLDLKFTSRSTGRVGRTTNVEWYTFDHGKIADINVYYKDAGLVAALNEPE